MSKLEAFLESSLTKVLGWDAQVTKGVVDAISKAPTAEAIQEIVDNFMQNDAQALSIVSDYVAAKHGTPKGAAASAGSARGARPGSSARPAAPLAQGDAQAAPSAPRDGASAARQHAEASLSMFKRGGRIRSSSKAAGGGASAAAAAPAPDGQPDRQVVNCLSCGKVYDCRNVTQDIVRFLDGGCACTYCGTHVSLAHADRGQNGAAGAGGAAPPAAESASPGAEESAQAFKDRLVDYDRNSAKRTTVIDDQGDYFEIDANAWLTDQERDQLRQRQRLEEVAAEASRRRVRVTLDLIGRRVLLEDPSDAGDSVDTADGGQAGAGGGAGGSGAVAVAADDVVRMAEAVKNLHITRNPDLKQPPPVFVPQALLAGGGGGGGGARQRGRGGSGGGQSRAQQQQKQHGNGAAAAAAASSSGFDSMFDEFEMLILCEQTAN